MNRKCLPRTGYHPSFRLINETALQLRTTAAIEALQRLLPEQARAVRAGQEVLVPLAEVAVGDCLHVLAGERIPCDGVTQGPAAVDEQMWTGESRPAVKEAADRLLAGSLNLDGDVFLTVTAPATESALARLVSLVRQARQTKGHYERPGRPGGRLVYPFGRPDGPGDGG